MADGSTMMRVEVRSRNVDVGPDLRTWIDRRLAFALGRFGHRVGRVRVSLTDLNGPRGGADVGCLVEAKLARDGTVVAEVIDSEVGTAVSRAAERLARRVKSTLNRQRDLRRRPRAVPRAADASRPLEDHDGQRGAATNAGEGTRRANDNAGG